MMLFKSCHSPQRLYLAELDEYFSDTVTYSENFVEEDIAGLPEPVQRYFRHCGYIGTQKTDVAEIIWQESQIKLQPGQKWKKLKTRQYNFISEPSRLAYMRANLLGIIPFEGRDKYHAGEGHMFGTLGRLIRVFDQKDMEIAKGAAIVMLAEALLVPNIALQNYIAWEPVDLHTANARFMHMGIDVGGTFHFNDVGEYTRFTTAERPYSTPSGGYENHPYTIEVLDYQQLGTLLIAKEVKATWNLPDGDFTYWRGIVKEIKFIHAK